MNISYQTPQALDRSEACGSFSCQCLGLSWALAPSNLTHLLPLEGFRFHVYLLFIRGWLSSEIERLLPDLNLPCYPSFSWTCRGDRAQIGVEVWKNVLDDCEKSFRSIWIIKNGVCGFGMIENVWLQIAGVYSLSCQWQGWGARKCAPMEENVP